MSCSAELLLGWVVMPSTQQNKTTVLMKPPHFGTSPRMALAAAVAKLSKLLSSETLCVMDIETYTTENLLVLREKALSRGLARKLLSMLLQEAAEPTRADVFPAILGVISIISENASSLRALIEENLGKAVHEV